MGGAIAFGEARILAEPPGVTLPDMVAAIRAHSDFDQAMLGVATALVTGFEGNPLVNRVMNDRVRALFAVAALYLDAVPDPAGRRLTPARMIALVTSLNLSSPGRAKAMLALLRWGGYLEPGTTRGGDERSGDRRERPLVPTEKLWLVLRTRWESFFQAMVLLQPDQPAKAAVLQDKQLRSSLVATLGGAFRAGFRPLDHAPVLRAAAERDGGMMMLLGLVVAKRGGAPPLLISDLSARFGVSRAHVLSVMREAESAGLIARHVSGRIEATPVLLDNVAGLIAAVLAMMTWAAGEVLAGR